MTERKISTVEIESAVVKLFNKRVNIIIPNVFWGLNFLYELDLLVINKNGYGYEIEIKASMSDLRADHKKQHFHDSKRIKYLYYAIPEYMMASAQLFIPDYAGIIIIKRHDSNDKCCAEITAKPKVRNKYKFSDNEKLKILHLISMRYWNTQETLIERCNELKCLRSVNNAAKGGDSSSR